MDAIDIIRLVYVYSLTYSPVSLRAFYSVAFMHI